MADGQKSEQPTQRRLLKAREEGNFASSRHFIAGAHFLAFVAVLQAFGQRWLNNLCGTMAWLFRHAFEGELTLNGWMSIIWRLGIYCGLPILCGAGALMLLNLGLQLGLTKMGFSFKKLTPDFTRLNPASRLKQTFRNNIQSVIYAVVLLPVSAYVIYVVVSNNLQLLALPLKTLPAAQADVFHSFGTLLWRSAGLFFVFGCVDLFREKRKFTSDLRMTKQEIKDEHKETQGSPEMKMRIRRIQRDQARKRMMQHVPKATAVIVNPTHFAVALRYEPETMAAPVVVAKGKDYLALRIRQVALDNQVPLIENPPLARGLYKAVEVGHEIPQHLYKAVAEILAYIFRLRQRR
jgi:flagellar biosynthetic protein FlhB